MASTVNPPLLPKQGDTLKVLGIARISTEHQDALSLQDQEALYRSWLTRHTDRPFELSMIAGRGSGECLERREYLQAWDEVESRQFDLVLAEDLGRIARRTHAVQFCEHCEDHGARLIALNDQIDTAQENWRLLAGLASMRHEMYNADTAKRIRRTLRNRFQNGGVIQFAIYGYVKPPGAKTDSELVKDPTAGPIYEQIFQKLEDGATYAEVADWLNDQKVAPGPFCRCKRWAGSLVAQTVHNPILKGVRVRNKYVSKRINSTGRHVTVKAPPSELLTRHCPHLAFIEPEHYDRVIRLIDARNSKYRRKLVAGQDPRHDVPKKRTAWPGQHLACAICGRVLRYGAHGQTQNLFCAGAAAYQCWNAISVNGPLAAQRIVDAVRDEIFNLPDFDDVLVADVCQEAERLRRENDSRLAERSRQLSEVNRQIENMVRAIRDYGHSAILVQELQRLEVERSRLEDELRRCSVEHPSDLKIPSMAELRERAKAALDELSVQSPEFSRLVRRWIPKIHVAPVQLCDGGKPVPRAFLTLDLTPLLPQSSHGHALGQILQRRITVDLFVPPERERFRTDVVRLRALGWSEREVAQKLGTHQPVVQRAMALQRLMDRSGRTDAYELVTEPPADNDHWCRHRHSRYRFEPLSGYPLGTLTE